MSLLFTTVEVLNSPINDQKISLPLFNHGDFKEATLDIQPEEKTGDFVLLGPTSFNTFAVVAEEEDKQDAEDSSESSSIGVQSSSSSEEDEEMRNEVQSKLKEGPFSSLDSLEDSLPIKRGLSNFFTGKSKSFASLCDASAYSGAKDLKKEENPFNKRRRILIANKISRSRRASYSSLFSPAHVLKEGTEEEDERGEENFSLAPLPKPLNHGFGRGLNKAFKSPRSFSLSDLQHV